tara:strand:- start:1937 stop:2704 length:768 start_codon:yes stop_codon:yes gene_type:complete
LSISIDFKGKNILITGGTKGIGKGIAETFLKANACVFVCARNSPKKIPKVGSNTAKYIYCDVKDPVSIEKTINEIIKKYQSIDVLINNAGGGPMTEAATTPIKLSESIVKLNLLAPFYVGQQANSIMQKQKFGGNIINICSVSVLRPTPGAAVYGSAKAGLANLTQSLAIEWAPKVRVNAIVCGLIQTEQSEKYYGNKESLQEVSNTIPLNRMGLPEDVGKGCLFLASELANYISGATLEIHGGGERPHYQNAID